MKQAIQNLILIFVSCALIAGANASSSVIRLDKAEIRLLDGGQISQQQRLAGLEILLNPGVKTYWRMPGDSGLPPVFDFAASQNIAHVEVKWPLPSRLVEADGMILGFKERVIFPLIVTPKNPDEPVTLAVKLDFGLCDTLCLPANADVQTSLTGGSATAARADIETFLAQVPKAATVKGDVQPAILSVAPEAKALVVFVASDTPLRDLILEASGSWYFGLPDIAPDGEGRYRATVPIEQKPSSAALAGLGLTVTAIAEGRASETALTLDASGSIR